MQTALFIFIQRKWAIDRKILSKFINYYNSIQKKVFVSYFKLVLISFKVHIFF